MLLLKLRRMWQRRSSAGSYVLIVFFGGIVGFNMVMVVMRLRGNILNNIDTSINLYPSVLNGVSGRSGNSGTNLNNDVRHLETAASARAAGAAAVPAPAPVTRLDGVIAPPPAPAGSRHARHPKFRTTDMVHVQPGLLFVGVMTANQFLDSRAVAVHDTWGQDVQNRMAFFTSEKSGGPPDLPIVRLKGVTDQYPPQKKSFMMLKYMYDHYIDKFEWFMRADDDVYIRADRLESFLSGINSSQPMFIGQAGFGNAQEFGHLKLKKDNYCMGGPGIVMSRTTLKMVYPHIRTCLSNLYTDHEDVEIGRCVKKYAGVSCLWNYEMRDIFYHDRRGTEAFMGSLTERRITGAITLHPIKIPTVLYRLHNFFLDIKIKEAMHQKAERHRQILRSDPDDETLTDFERRMGSPPMLSKTPITREEDNIGWFHIANRYMTNSAQNQGPYMKLSNHLKDGVTDATNALMDYMLSFSQERGRSLQMQDINYGYYRMHPQEGVVMVVDIVLKYVRFRGKKLIQTVRRHAYLQQSFGYPEIRVLARENDNTVVHVIVGLAGKAEPFMHFCDNLEKIGLINVKVYFVIYEQDTSPEEMKIIRDRISQLRERFSSEEINTHTVTDQPFTRAGALTIGKSLLTDDSLALFMDIDIIFDHQSIDNVRQFTQRGKQAYFPMVFSEYDPVHVRRDPDYRDSIPEVDVRRGKYRFYGYGIAAIYVSDVDAVGGFNQDITGWGKEDVDFADRVLNHPRNYTIFRTADPGMIHKYHTINCAKDLAKDQAEMCAGTRFSFQADFKTLAKEFLNSSEIAEFTRTLSQKREDENQRTHKSKSHHVKH